MDVKYYLTLCRGIITHPNWAFDQIIKKRLITAAIVIWLVVQAFSFLAYYITLCQTFGIGKISIISFAISYFTRNHQIIFGVFVAFLSVYLENIMAVKHYKFESNYLNLLACSLFISLLGIPTAGLQIIFVVLIPLPSISTFLTVMSMVIFGVWGLILHIKALKMVYNTITGTAIIIFLFSTIVIMILSRVYLKMLS